MYVVICITLLWIVLDVITGTIKAAKYHEMDSTKMREGLFNKIGYILCMAVGVGVDYTMLYVNIGYDIPILEGICVMIILTELISICENIVKINPALAGSKFFDMIKEKQK